MTLTNRITERIRRHLIRYHPWRWIDLGAAALQAHYLRRVMGEVGPRVRFYGRIIALYPEHIRIGEGTSLNDLCLLNGRGGLTIGRHCHISAGVQIHTAGLDLSFPYDCRPHMTAPVRIEDGVWIGAGSIVLPGTTIGEGAVIAAGAVVRGSVPAFELWGGIPARCLKAIAWTAVDEEAVREARRRDRRSIRGKLPR